MPHRIARIGGYTGYFIGKGIVLRKKGGGGILSDMTSVALLRRLPLSLWLFAGSLLLCLSAHVAIPLWFTPVPVTLQTFVVFLLSGLLGRRAVWAVALYLLEGSLGFPVFGGGAAGIAVLVGPRAGYLLGFLVSASVMSSLMERSRGSFPKIASLLALGSLIILGLGALYLARFVGFKAAFLLGVAPFLLGEAVKVCVASVVLRQFRFLLN